MSLPSAEVAADFKDALQDLKINSRPEISNLTIIAKENTEHAQAISRELENHIKTTRPEWKLPALYVLDSIVKNVGTPYTVYLGRNLYRTFMDAYMLMDEPTRKAMEGLLRTWKQSVPESMDPRPVFPADVTRDIENALIKYRTIVVQHAQRSQKPPMQQAVPARPMPNMPWRDTPTPPQSAARYTPSNDPRIRQQPLPSQFGAQFPPQAAAPNQFASPLSGYHQRSPSVDLDTINSTLEELINTTRADWASNPSDTTTQQKLKALLDLQSILKTQTLPPDQLRQIHAQVQQLSTPKAPAPSFPPPIPPPVIQLPQQQASLPFQPPNNSLNLAQILANARPPVSASPSPASTSLADLLRRTTTPMQSSGTPVSVPTFFNSPFSAPPAPAPIPTPTAPAAGPSLAQLLQQFHKGGSAAAPPPPPQPPAQPTSIGAPDWLLEALTTPFPPPARAPPSPTLFEAMSKLQKNMTMLAENDAALNTASMKKPRQNLIHQLYEAHSNQCVTCGRRFDHTPEDKERKARHMDWHFKVKDPDLAKRGVHRSWYINERDWIDYREVDEAAPEQVANGGNSGGPAAGPRKQTKDQYVPVPTDAGLVHAPCPICQERFEPQWLVEANDFVWMDAIKVNSKIYHATCWEEYSRGGGGYQAPGTPDSVLGKRKADASPSGGDKKMRAA